MYVADQKDQRTGVNPLRWTPRPLCTSHGQVARATTSPATFPYSFHLLQI
jgi:hypothetical protein